MRRIMALLMANRGLMGCILHWLGGTRKAGNNSSWDIVRILSFTSLGHDFC